jgi:hypothetical protein
MDGPQLVVSFAGLTGLAYTLVNWLRSVVNIKDPASRSAFVTQLVAYAVCVATAWAGAQADDSFGQVIPTGTIPLSEMDGWSLVLIGLGLGGVAGSFAKFLQARDNTDSATVPTFLPTPSSPPPPVA